jgi:hypothetical protein
LNAGGLASTLGILATPQAPSTEIREKLSRRWLRCKPLSAVAARRPGAELGRQTPPATSRRLFRGQVYITLWFFPGPMQTRRRRSAHLGLRGGGRRPHSSTQKDQVLAVAGGVAGWFAWIRSLKASAIGLNSIFPSGPSRRAVQASSVASPTWTTITAPT